ncbi:MAG: hypothetical protein IJ217_01005 [Clostridia bacterium]|nr:hypothetical protein [Clostridia bacterium]
MKKFIFLIMILLGVNSIVFAYSKSFEYMVDVMGIEKSGKGGYVLNEEIYQAYNQFVYGSPLMIPSTQRWKDVSDGKWTKNGGIWQGTGTRGEYWVLGYNVSGEFIHNHQFPVDIEPPTPPTEWRYVPLAEAEDSWNDVQMYRYEEQKIYMQTAKLTRNQIVYDLTAADIGFDKAKIENYATWKTNGNIYTRRYDRNNQEWAANFIVPPMAADAALSAKLYFPEGEAYTIAEDEESILIPVEYGTEVVNLTDFAKAEHVKRIYAEVEVNDSQVDSVEAAKALSVSKQSYIVVRKSDYPNQANIELEVSCNSLLLTEFTVDGALVDTNTKIIHIKVEGIEESEENKLEVKRENRNYEMDAIPPHIDSIDLGRQENGKIVPLKIVRKTNSAFICAGQVLAIEVETSNADYITLEFSGDASIVTLDDLTEKFEWTDPRSRGVSTRYTSLAKLKAAYQQKVRINPYKTREEKSYFKYYYVIPYKTKQTFHSWSSLREISRDAFSIDESQLFTRKTNPYGVVIKAYSSEGVRTKSVSLDVFERWDTLYNRDLTPYIK